MFKVFKRIVSICILFVSYGQCCHASHGCCPGLAMLEFAGIFYIISAQMASFTTSWAFILTLDFLTSQTGRLSFNDPYKIVRLEIHDDNLFEEALKKAS